MNNMSSKESVGEPNGLSGHVDHGEQNGETAAPPIAVVGMSCRLPGQVSNLEAFWEFCLAARNAWTEIPQERFNTTAFYHPDPEKSGSFHIKGAHFLQASVAAFDAPFFNITENEAKSMDPRHRILLECAYEALENAGIPINSVAGSDVGVFVAGTLSHYELQCLRDPPTLPRLHYMGCADSLLANRISYFFDLHGPSLTLDTACSSGLTALHMACQSLRTGDISQAIVGGTHLNLMPEMLASTSSAMFLSADGKCYPFDERVSGGFGPGEGASCVILKPLKDAIEAGDCIRAIIRGTGINQDGRTAGISLPSSEAQAKLVKSVYRSANLDPADTKFIEAHGTGTTAGDPLEAAAFASTIARKATPEDPICIGSAKSNFGHLEGVSGLVSLIKAALMLEHKVILPNANFNNANPKIGSLNTQLKVPQCPENWSSTGARRVSVNNLGFGGANAHAILEEAPSVGHTLGGSESPQESHLQNGTNDIKPLVAPGFDTQHLFIITANDNSTVQRQIVALITYLTKRRDHPNTRLLPRLAFTLGQRRSLLPWKLALVASTADELMTRLGSADKTAMRSSRAQNLGFVFTGQGANWQGMGRELFQAYPVFSSAMIAADKFLAALGASWSLNGELFSETESSLFQEAQFSQPACTAIQLALVQLLDSFGLRPCSVIGHSSGEIGAAFAAGALTFETCLSIAYHRGVVAGNLKQKYPDVQGAMLALGAGPTVATTLLLENAIDDKAVIACFNSPSSVTLSGEAGAIIKLKAAAEEKGIFARQLKVDTAYHSPHMNLVADDYKAAIGKVKPLLTRKVQFYSSLTGAKISTLALGASYWVNNLKSPVQFATALSTCCSLNEQQPTGESAATHLIEIGPHSALKGPIRDILVAAPKMTRKIGYSSTLLRKENAVVSILSLASELFIQGCNMNMTAINFPRGIGQTRVLADLPPYPWNHEIEYWHESRISYSHRMKSRPRHDLLGTLVPESSDLEPWWRNILRLDDLPWLRHHRIRSNAVFPFAGYVSMAVEASIQRAESRNIIPSAIEFHEICNSQPLILLEGYDTEIMLTLRPLVENRKTSSDTWDEFRVLSWTEDSAWVERCRGQIAAISKNNCSTANQVCQPAMATSSVKDHESTCGADIDGRRIYDDASKVGMSYGPCMKMLSDCRAGDGKAMANVRVPDTASTMPLRSEAPLSVHPALLENCMHIIWPLLGAGLGGVEGLFLPATLERISIQVNSNKKQSGDLMKVYGTASKGSQPSERVFENIIIIDPTQGEGPPSIAITGLVLSFYSDNQASPAKLNRTQYSRMQWEPCIDMLEPEEFRRVFASEKPQSDEVIGLKDLERASLFYIQSALEAVDESHYHSLHGQHQKLYRLMQKQLHAAKENENQLLDADWNALGEPAREKFLASIRERDTSGELICKVGEKLPQILLNMTDSLSIMFADDLLERYYRASKPLRRTSEQTAHLLGNLAHENPHLRILEIAAGTEGTTLPVLKRWDGILGRAPRFHDYVFTGVSSVFFEKSREEMKEWGPLLTFQKLNIEKDPLGQNFEPESFDVIVAAHVLHATARISQTLHHVRKLLKPGGRLILVEVMSAKAQLFPFATLPEWWLREPEDELRLVKDFMQLDKLEEEDFKGKEESRADGPLLTEIQWDRILKQTGFSGVDRSLHDYPGESVQANTVVVSTALFDDEPLVSRDLIIIQSHESSRYSIDELKDALSTLPQANPVRVLPLAEVAHMDLKRYDCIFLDELESPMLSKISGPEYQAIQNLCTALGILWVVEGAQTDPPSNPESCMAIGLARSIRSENPGTRLVTLDLDAEKRLPASRTSQMIARVCRAVFTQEGGQERPVAQESEFLERNGILHIPRVVPDMDMEECVQGLIRDPVPEPQSSLDGHPALSLRMGTFGSLDSFFLEHDEAFNKPLQPGDVEIQVRASGLNFQDVMIALGKLPEESFGLDCAGTIIAVGPKVQDLAVGDRVCAVSPGAFGTVMRCAAPCAVKIPADTSFEVAASMPMVCTTVYHSLINVAGLRKGETLLVHAAAGGVGQNAIMLSQSLGVEIFATVSNAQKKAILMTKYGMPEDHIFFSRDTSFEEKIKSITHNRGVDVVLSASSGDLRRATWRCLAHFGRYIDIGKADFLANNRLEMEPFLHNRVYAAVDVRSLASERPLLMKELLLNVIDLHIRKVFKPIEPLEVYPYSQIEAAFCKIQDGENIGKIVLIPEIRGLVRIMPRKEILSSIRADVTYLITGGSGSLGISFAAWLAQHGAKYIALVSRGGVADAKTKRLFHDWQTSGVTVVLAKCDVTDPEQVEAIVRQKLAHMPPVKGVIHGVNVPQSVLFEKSTVEDYLTVMRPKVFGAWNLHNTLLNNKLDFFISIGSASGIFGSRGDSGYCATTTFLEAFSAYRASLGLAATTIDLGAVMEVGGLTKQSVLRQNLAKDLMGCEVSEQELLAIIDVAISGKMKKESHYCSIAGLQCTGSSPQSYWSQAPMFAHVRVKKVFGQKEEDRGTIKKESVRRQLVGAASLAEARKVVYDALAIKMSKVLMIADEDVSPDKAFASYGSDSLVAVDIRNWIRREMEATVMLVEILADNTLTSLTESILRKSTLCERSRES